MYANRAAVFWMRCKGEITESSQERVALVEAGDDECLDQELRCFPREEGSDPVDVVKSKSAGSGHRGDVGCAGQLVIQYDAEVPRSWGPSPARRGAQSC